MNLNELKAKYIQYLTEKGELDDEKLSKLSSGLASIFFLGSDFTQFVKENLSSLGLKDTGKIPNTISEILEMAEEDEGEEYDLSELTKADNKSSNETTYNKDYSKNFVNNTYDSNGKLVNQKASVYSASGTQKSEYNIEFGAEGDVNKEFQIEYGAATDNTSDMAIGYSEQGEKGDCWLLATLNSLSYTDSGKDLIKNAITKNDDGTYSIEFKGVNTSIKITQEELTAAKQSGNYAKGDDDVTLFELGFESVIDKIQKGEIEIPGNHPGLSIKPGDTTAPLAGGNLEDAIFLLTGKDVKSEFKNADGSTENFDKILSSLKDNPGKYAATIGFTGGENGFVLKDINGNEICTLDAGTNHAFSIKSVDEDGVTIVNPWDSSKEYKISLADARKFGTSIQYYATDESFVETDTLDSTALDEAPTQSSNKPADSTETPEETTETPETTDTPESTDSPTSTDTPTSTPSSSSSPSGGGSYSPTSSQETQKDPNDIKNMSLDQLKAKKSTTENELKSEQDKYNAVMNGTDEKINELQTAKEKAYEEFQTQLKEKNADLAADYDKAKADVEAKEKEIDENDKQITDTKTQLSAAETKVTNAESKVSTLESTVSSLESALSSADDKNKADIQAKLTAAKAALESAKQELETAKTERDKVKEDLEKLEATKTTLEEELKPLEEAVSKLEGEIQAITGEKDNPADPELRAAYDAYKDAEKALDDGKTEKVKAAKEAIEAKQTEINEIDKQITVLENNKAQREYSTSKLPETYTLNGKEYMSLFSQNDLDNFLANEWKNGNYNYNSNCLSMAQLYCKDIMNQLGLSSNYQDYIDDNQDNVEQKAKESLDNGYPVVLHVSTKAGTRHFATAVGYRVDDNGKITFLLADNVRGVGITACGEGEYRHLITGYSTPYKNQNYGYRCMIYG